MCVGFRQRCGNHNHSHQTVDMHQFRVFDAYEKVSRHRLRVKCGRCPTFLLWAGIFVTFVLVQIMLSSYYRKFSDSLLLDPLPHELVTPTQKVFRKMTVPNSNVPTLYRLIWSQKFHGARKFERFIPMIKEELQDFRTMLNELPQPSFPYTPGSTGILTTCKLGPICVANLHHLFETMRVNLPIGLCHYVCLFVVSLFILCLLVCVYVCNTPLQRFG